MKYSLDAAKVAPYSKELVSWPISGVVSLKLVVCLGPAAHERVRDWSRHMLRDAACTARATAQLGV